jgi:hypothetical protein
MALGKFFALKKRYDKANEHSGQVPRDHCWCCDRMRAVTERLVHAGSASASEQHECTDCKTH